MDGMGDLFGQQNQVCQSYSCPAPNVPINKWPLSITSTGCQGGGGMSMFSMGGSNYKHIEHCCHMKNACYQLCGSEKKTCDIELKKCMERGCEDLSDLTAEEKESMSEEDTKKEKEECGKMKGIVELIGNMGGCTEYDSHQRSHCECVDKDKQGDKMERVLRNFYRKFNPEAVDKVKGLLQRAGGKRSIFNKILHGLVKKHPEAIKKQELKMPDPMNMDL